MAATFAIVISAGCGGGGDGGCSGSGQASEPVTIVAQTPNVVSTWHDVASNTINVASAATGTPEEQRPTLAVDMATVHVAIYDAVMAIVGTHQPYAADPSIAATGASVDAAATAAAYWALAGLFPNRASQYQAPYDEGLAKIPDGEAKTRGIAIGKDVATRILALRANDGRAVQLPAYVPGTAPGHFRGTNPINTYGPYMKPFSLTSAAQFRAPGPPDAREHRLCERSQRNEGGGRLRQRGAHRAADGGRAVPHGGAAAFPGAQLPPVRDEPAERRRERAARRAGLGDGGRHDDRVLRGQVPLPVLAAVERDHAGRHRWQRRHRARHRVDTPRRHAESPRVSGGALCVAGAIGESLNRYFGTRQVSFSMTSTVTSTVRSYESTDAFVSESALVRIWGGMHFRTSTDHGAALGRNVANWVADHHFRRN